MRAWSWLRSEQQGGNQSGSSQQGLGEISSPCMVRGRDSQSTKQPAWPPSLSLGSLLLPKLKLLDFPLGSLPEPEASRIFAGFPGSDEGSPGWGKGEHKLATSLLLPPSSWPRPGSFLFLTAGQSRMWPPCQPASGVLIKRDVRGQPLVPAARLGSRHLLCMDQHWPCRPSWGDQPAGPWPQAGV